MLPIISLTFYPLVERLVYHSKATSSLPLLFYKTTTTLMIKDMVGPLSLLHEVSFSFYFKFVFSLSELSIFGL